MWVLRFPTSLHPVSHRPWAPGRFNGTARFDPAFAAMPAGGIYQVPTYASEVRPGGLAMVHTTNTFHVAGHVAFPSRGSLSTSDTHTYLVGDTKRPTSPPFGHVRPPVAFDSRFVKSVLFLPPCSLAVTVPGAQPDAECRTHVFGASPHATAGAPAAGAPDVCSCAVAPYGGARATARPGWCGSLDTAGAAAGGRWSAPSATATAAAPPHHQPCGRCWCWQQRQSTSAS